MKYLKMFLTFGIIGLQIILFGQTPDQIKLTELEKTIYDDIKISGAPGAVIGVVKDGQVIYQKAFGLSNINTEVPVKNETIFQIGSITKIFTAATLLTICERSKIDINEPIGNFIKDLSPKLSKVTIHQLLNHSSGIIDSWQNTNECNENAHEYFIKAGDNAFFEEPESVFSYSNNGYALAGLLLATLNKSSYNKAISDFLLKPLKMINTTFNVNEIVINDFATGHINGKAVPISSWITGSINQPAGGLFSNVSDMAKFATCLMDTSSNSSQILSRGVINRMSEHSQANGFPRQYLGYPNSYYGCGLISYTYKGIDFIGNGGETGSQNALLIMAPKFNTAVMIFSNTGYYPFMNSLEKAVDIFLPVKEEQNKGTHFKQDNNQLIGRYYTSNLTKTKNEWVDIELKNNQLHILFSDKRTFELTQLADDRFYFQDPNFKFSPDIIFFRDKSGRIRYLNHLGRAYKKD